MNGEVLIHLVIHSPPLLSLYLFLLHTLSFLFVVSERKLFLLILFIRLSCDLTKLSIGLALHQNSLQMSGKFPRFL